MSDIGIIPVDWEDRFNPQRMLRERLDRAKEALDNSEADVLFVFRTENQHFQRNHRHFSRKHPIFQGNTVV